MKVDRAFSSMFNAIDMLSQTGAGLAPGSSLRQRHVEAVRNGSLVAAAAATRCAQSRSGLHKALFQFASEEGQDLVEYALLLGIVAVGAVALLKTVATPLLVLLFNAVTAVESA